MGVGVRILPEGLVLSAALRKTTCLGGKELGCNQLVAVVGEVGHIVA